MHETFPNPDSVLAFEALLYASGELGADELKAFEARLASDQSAREALGQAVQLTMSLNGEVVRPNPGWRQQAKARLLQPAALSFRDKAAERRGYRGHPLIWILSGAAAALLLVSVALPRPSVQVPGTPTIAQARPEHKAAPVEKDKVEAPDEQLPPSEVGTELVAFSPTDEEAYFWAKLHNTDHLAKAHSEETRRQLRIEEQRRMTSRMDERTKGRSYRPSSTP